MSFDQDLNEARRQALAGRSNVGPVGLQLAEKAPRDWKITTLQRLFTVSSGDFLSPGDLQEEGFPVFGGNGFRGYFRDTNCDPNTMLIGRYGALCGNVHIPPEPFWATEHAFRVRPLIEYHQPFVAQYVEALELRYLAARAAQPGLNSRMVREQAIALPDLATQRQIADFLDRETARIDLLIEKKQRLATVLQEKLSAAISNAVRGYLTSHDAPRRRDIEWFDSYPEHWTRMPLKALGNGHRSVFIDGDWIESTDLADEGIRYLTTGNVGPGTYREQGAGFISTETFARLKCTEVFPGDILISRLNPPIGRACIVPDLGTSIVTSVDNVIVRPGDHVDRQYIVHLLTSREHFENTGNIARGTTMQRISRSALGKIRIPLPPLAEQREISRHLSSEVQWQQSLSERISYSIDRLKKYRAALITAAVTGQIDVTTYAKSGTSDHRLDAIQEEMGA